MRDLICISVGARRRVQRQALAVALPLLLIAGSGLAHAKAVEPPAVLGPAPSWERFTNLAELHVKAMLVDPGSAQFTWSKGYRGGVWKPLLQRRVNGYIACGYVNSRNRMGGYVGATSFVVVIDGDAVLFAELGRPTSSDLVTLNCAQATSANYFPPISEMPGVGGSGPAQPSHGFVVSKVPDGAYVASVVASSPAERAGLRPGMVITQLNGVALNGMDAEAVMQILDRTQGTATLSVVGGMTLTIARTAAAAAAAPNGNEARSTIMSEDDR